MSFRIMLKGIQNRSDSTLGGETILKGTTDVLDSWMIFIVMDKILVVGKMSTRRYTNLSVGTMLKGTHVGLISDKIDNTLGV